MTRGRSLMKKYFTERNFEFFPEIFQESSKKQFSWNLMLRHCEIDVKLVFHEIL